MLITQCIISLVCVVWLVVFRKRIEASAWNRVAALWLALTFFALFAAMMVMIVQEGPEMRQARLAMATLTAAGFSASGAMLTGMYLRRKRTS